MSRIIYGLYEGVWMGNYQRYPYSTPHPVPGVVVVSQEDFAITRHMFHPYSGAPPIHCAVPVAGRTYHRSKGYS